jgi:capsular polysaccharide biosynthesis protein
MPREGASSGALSTRLAQFGGLAEMAGLSLGQGSKQEPLGVLRSDGFARRFLEQNNLVAVLAEEAGEIPDEAPGAPDRKVQRVVETFKDSVLSIAEDKKTGLVTVSIEWKDPVIAAKWANAIARQLNEEMRQRALNEATRNVNYLQDQLEHTETVSLQQAIARLIESEMQKLMLAQGTDEYALRVIDNAEPPSLRSRPKRTMLVLAAFTASLIASLLGAIAIDPLQALWRQVRGTSL